MVSIIKWLLIFFLNWRSSFICCYSGNSIFWDSSSKPRWWSPWLWTLRWWLWVFMSNPTYTPIISKDFLRALPHCPIIHWASLMCNDPRLCYCPCWKHSSPRRKNNNIFIHHDHECMVDFMTPQELLRQLRSEGDSTHTVIFIYLETLNTFSQGLVRQDPSVKSKKNHIQRKWKWRKRRRRRR